MAVRYDRQFAANGTVDLALQQRQNQVLKPGGFGPASTVSYRNDKEAERSIAMLRPWAIFVPGSTK